MVSLLNLQLAWKTFLAKDLVTFNALLLKNGISAVKP
jgi:hypothetical protein